MGANSGTVTDSFYDIETSLMSDDTGKGMPKTTEEMTDVATFTTEIAVGAGLETAWDFVGNHNDDTGNNDYSDISAAVNDGYPYLQFFQWESVFLTKVIRRYCCMGRSRGTSMKKDLFERSTSGVRPLHPYRIATAPV